ncbi:hypothetical protein TSOC_012857 [Tetrabaena socialis]|uniref:Uncharacterized protein n=1 Tax=Tetrabaena socialis TaxID=47790 RepID=A0A2J7ZLX0_9CHLO|nr:hypothetical protein TSOC_012857 [Tetrabaena socialis]|eukprot:PNH01268.1 hypothetical protein TSOC_012857 [Tetrabaena socialis]
MSLKSPSTNLNCTLVWRQLSPAAASIAHSFSNEITDVPMTYGGFGARGGRVTACTVEKDRSYSCNRPTTKENKTSKDISAAIRHQSGISPWPAGYRAPEQRTWLRENTMLSLTAAAARSSPPPLSYVCGVFYSPIYKFIFIRNRKTASSTFITAVKKFMLAQGLCNVSSDPLGTNSCVYRLDPETMMQQADPEASGMARAQQNFNSVGVGLFFSLFGGRQSLALPHLAAPDIRHVDWAALRAAGFSGLVFDKDNTLSLPFALEVVQVVLVYWKASPAVPGP